MVVMMDKKDLRWRAGLSKACLALSNVGTLGLGQVVDVVRD